jgi:pilus assembly protein CpaF
MKRFGRRDQYVPTPDPNPAGPNVGGPSLSGPGPNIGADRPPPGPPPVGPALTALRISDLRARVLRQIDPAAAVDLPAAVLQRQLEQMIHEIANEERFELSAREQTRLAEELANDMIGLGPLEPLLRDETITDIMVNAPDNVYVERRGKLGRVDIRFRDGDHIAGIAQKIASRVGRRIDESSPMVDARLADGSRVNVIFPPLAVDSPCISIRKFSRYRMDFPALVETGSMSAGVSRLLGIAARCRLNVLISGGTGSGKTTLLNAMSQLIDHGERIISVEDAAELQLLQPHVIRLETRAPNLEGQGGIAQRDLLRNALRMRPDRIILGEVRGSEAFDMLQAMNTGHDGSISTVHSNSTRDALTRIENMVQMGSFNLPARAIRSQIVSAIDLIVQVERMRDGTRRVIQISEVCNLEGDVITMNDVVNYEFEREDSQSRIIGHYVSTSTRPGFMRSLEYYGLDRAWTAALASV